MHNKTMNRPFEIVATYDFVAAPTVSFAGTMEEAIEWAQWYADRGCKSARVYHRDGQEVLFDAGTVPRKKPLSAAVAGFQQSAQSRVG